MNPLLRVLVERAARGDRDAEARALKELGTILEAIANEWHIPGMEQGDILQEARIAALAAIRQFDPERGSSVEAFVRVCVPRHLGHVKDSATRRHAEPLAEELIEVAAAQPPATDEPDMDANIIREVWHWLTEAERRGVVVVLMQTEHATAAHLDGITKQAINKGWKSAQKLIGKAHATSVPDAIAGRRFIGPMEEDWKLEYALERLGR